MEAILNVASLLYLLLLLPLDALCYSHRANLVWFVDMVLYHKYESVQVLRNIALVNDVFVLEDAQHVHDSNYMIRIERFQRPAPALLMRDVQKLFPEWQRLQSAKWILMCASACVRLKGSLYPMIQKHAASMPAGAQHTPLSQRPLVEQVLLSLQHQHGAFLGVHPTCQELSPFVSLADEPARVTNSAVRKRLADTHVSLPHSQQALAAEHSGFLLEHFSQHGPGDANHVCDQCGNIVDIDCIEHVYRASQLMSCSERCYEASLPASYVKEKFQRRAPNPRAHSYGRGPHGGTSPCVS